MKHILRFLRFIRVILVVLCILIVASAIFPNVFSWSTEEGKEQIQEFVDNVKDSTGRLIADISEKTGLFQSGNEKETNKKNTEQNNPDASAVTGRADYKAPEEIGQEITGIQKEDAEDNQNSQSIEAVEDTPNVDAENRIMEDSSFDTLYYPYFGILTKNEQSLYKQLYENMIIRNEEFDLKTTVNAESLAKVFEAVYNDHPEIFWLDTSYQYGYYSSGKVATVILNFNETAEDMETAMAHFTEAAQPIIQGALAFDNALDRERYIHDALNERTEYDENSPLNQSAYSALVNGASVCAGYSRAFQYLMQQVGIPCYYCVGYANGEHAWNIVYIDGVYYPVDVSWDDGSANPYQYFNLSEEEFSLTHSVSGLSKRLFAG